MNWHLLQTKPNAHFIACENLRRQGFDVFLPLIIKTTKKNGKFLTAKVPLFPGYLFGHLNRRSPGQASKGQKAYPTPCRWVAFIDP